MNLFELFILAVGLSMDAFAVAICKGLSIKKANVKKCLLVGLYFGGFQAFMPIIGYLFGIKFKESIINFDHWIAFILLLIIGSNMIKEAFSSDDEEINESTDIRSMIVLALATSIDALAVGVTFAFLRVNIIPAVTFIGIITFIFSFSGVKIGNIFGKKYKSKSEFAGGIILIFIGIKILLEHLGIFV